MTGGVGFIIITVGKLGLAIGTAIGFSACMNWYHKHEGNSKNRESGKRVYQSKDVRNRLNYIPK
jgi:hypothetical protein